MYDLVKKKRGGQLGNQNARTCGYYSNYFPVTREPEIFDAARLPAVDNEIAIIRAKFKQVVEKDPDNISAMTCACNKICRLFNLKIKIERSLNHG